MSVTDAGANTKLSSILAAMDGVSRTGGGSTWDYFQRDRRARVNWFNPAQTADAASWMGLNDSVKNDFGRFDPASTFVVDAGSDADSLKAELGYGLGAVFNIEQTLNIASRDARTAGSVISSSGTGLQVASMVNGLMPSLNYWFLPYKTGTGNVFGGHLDDRFSAVDVALSTSNSRLASVVSNTAVTAANVADLRGEFEAQFASDPEGVRAWTRLRDIANATSATNSYLEDFSVYQLGTLNAITTPVDGSGLVPGSSSVRNTAYGSARSALAELSVAAPVMSGTDEASPPSLSFTVPMGLGAGIHGVSGSGLSSSSFTVSADFAPAAAGGALGTVFALIRACCIAYAGWNALMIVWAELRLL